MRLSLFFLLALPACSSPIETPPTEVLVTIDATSAVRARTTSLTLLVSSSATRDGTYGDSTNRGFGPPAAAVAFPRRLGLIPLHGDATRFFEVRATAFGMEPGSTTMSPVAMTLVRSGYLPHRLLQLTIVLDDAECPSTCADGQTCRHGVCSAIFIDPTLLPDADAGTDAGPRNDGGEAGASDGGDGGDAGMPDGGDAGCHEDRDCDDGDTCNGTEKCLEGVCSPGRGTTCDDGVACTTNTCLASTGCTFTPNNALCTAGTAGHCDPTTGCQYSTCDAMTCMADGPTCMGATCVGATCMRASLCTASEECCGGRCIGVCDDHNPCTDDSCNAGLSVCEHVNNMVACSDGNPCTLADKCHFGLCMGGGPMFCDDGNTCTFDTCMAPAGCTFMPLAAGIVCDDGNACTGNDRCVAGGSCVGMTTGVCDDGNPCTVDSCDASGGCVYMAGNDGHGCNDLSMCVHGGVCSAGICGTGTGLDPCPAAGQTCCPSDGECYSSGAPICP